MKIIILTNVLSHGGAQRVAVTLANALSARHEVYMMTFSHESSYTLSDRVKFITIGYGKMRRRGLLGPLTTTLARARGWLYFSRFRLRERPDVTLSFLHGADLLNLLSPSGGGKRIMSERNNPRGKDKGYFREARFAFRFADKVVFQSETVMNMYPADIRRKGVVIPNPVSVTCKAVGSSKRIVTCGRIHSQKNHRLLIKAFSAFLPDHPEYTLHIYGEGELQKETEAFIASLSLQDKVFIERFKKDIHKYIADAGMFVLSSDYEGMPNALIEAMMMGIPCITTAFEGVEEFIGETGACLTTPVGDETALAKAMCEVADDGELRRTLASRGEALADKYSVENIVSLWEKEL